MIVDSTLVGSQTKSQISESTFFLLMAVLTLATAVVGFAPNTAAVVTGTMDWPPLLIHIHGACMLSWLLLLVTQTGLSSSGNIRLHRRLGLLSLVVVPALVLVMIVVTYVFLTSAPLSPNEAASAVMYNIFALQIRAIVLFPMLVGWALAARRSSPGTHKRLMLIATIGVLDAAIARMSWLPGTGAATYSSFEVMSAYQFLLMTPLIAYDYISRGRVHRATVIGIGAFVTFALIENVLWGSEWWLENAARLARVLS